MLDRSAPPGRQAAVLIGLVAAGYAVGLLAGAPFDIDVGAGHAVFHLTLGAAAGLAAAWLVRQRSPRPASRLAVWAAGGLAATQLIEGVVAIPDGSGDSVLHGVANLATLPALLAVLAALVALVVAARRPAPQG